jgi:large repetitive protein
VTSSKNPSNFGDAVTFTATVSGSAGGTSPTGTVTFTDLSTGQTLGTATLNISQQATVTTSSLSTGSHNIQASYDGDGNFGGSSATLTQVVNKAATTTAVTASPNPSVAGQPVTFTAMVSPTTPGGLPPTGTVTFLEGGNPIGSATLGSNGQAALTIATLSVGSHTITASYPGDGNFNPSSGSVTQLVNKNGTTTLVLSSANPSTLGQSVTFTAVLSPVTPIGSTPVPSGMVTFFADGNSIGTGTLGANGQATVSTAALTVGSHIITTTYGGDINFNGSNGTLNANQQVINAIGGTATTTTLMSSQNPSSIGQSVTFTATVSGSRGTPTGTVTFSVDGAAGTPIALSGGQALFTTSTLPLGNHNITAAYGGDTNFAASTTAAPLVQMVNKRPTTTTVVSSANPSNIGHRLPSLPR